MSNGTNGKKTSLKVVHYGVNHLGKVVDRGECWDLPFEALRHAKAKTPWDLGSDLYVWGERIDNLKDARPGDILQFEGVRIETTWTTGDGVTHERWYNFGERHSAIVEKVDGELFFTTLNAHINKRKKVQRLRINLSPENIKSGRIYLYRPIPKP